MHTTPFQNSRSQLRQHIWGFVYVNALYKFTLDIFWHPFLLMSAKIWTKFELCLCKKKSAAVNKPYCWCLYIWQPKPLRWPAYQPYQWARPSECRWVRSDCWGWTYNILDESPLLNWLTKRLNKLCNTTPMPFKTVGSQPSLTSLTCMRTLGVRHMGRGRQMLNCHLQLNNLVNYQLIDIWIILLVHRSATACSEKLSLLTSGNKYHHHHHHHHVILTTTTTIINHNKPTVYSQVSASFRVQSLYRIIL